MRTLFISHTYLDGNGGGVYASRTHINLFAQLSESMTLIYPCRDGKVAKHISQKRIVMVPIEDHRSKICKFIDLLCGKVHRFKLDKHYYDSREYDVVVFDNSVVSSRLIKRFNKAGFMTITIHHNYQIQYLMGDCSRLTLLPNLFWTWIYEGQAVRNSTLNITLTNQDLDLLKKHYCSDKPFAVLGVFEYQACEPVNVSDETRQHRYVITGGLGSKQTEDSLLKWLEVYYPLLMRVDPQAELTIAGSNPSAKLTDAILVKGINLISSPADMGPILKNADYYLCPVDCGGGLKLRNMDGLKYGLPVLTHKVSLRGYEKMKDSGVMFSYNNPSEFIIGLKTMKLLRFDRKTIQNIYKEQFNFDAGLASLKEILSKSHILKGHNSRIN